jgi:hypothetical protein
MAAIHLSNIINGDDVWMVEGRCSAGLPQKTPQPVFVPRELGGQQLERDPAMRPTVICKKNLPHAAATNFAEDFIRADTPAQNAIFLFVIQYLSDIPNRQPFDKTARLFLSVKERFDFEAQHIIAGAGLIKEISALVGRKLQGYSQQFIYLLPSFRRHNNSNKWLGISCHLFL